jgi:hypothetical protein
MGMAANTTQSNTTTAALAAVDAAYAAYTEAEKVAAWATHNQAMIHAKVAKEVNLWSDEDLEWWLKARSAAAAERRQAAAAVEAAYVAYQAAVRAVPAELF